MAGTIRNLTRFGGKERNDLISDLRVMTEKETRLEQAVRQVAETKRFITELQERIERLRSAGISTLEAERTLHVLCSNLPLLERYEKYVRKHTS